MKKCIQTQFLIMRRNAGREAGRHISSCKDCASFKAMATRLEDAGACMRDADMSDTGKDMTRREALRTLAAGRGSALVNKPWFGISLVPLYSAAAALIILAGLLSVVNRMNVPEDGSNAAGIAALPGSESVASVDMRIQQLRRTIDDDLERIRSRFDEEPSHLDMAREEWKLQLAMVESRLFLD